MFLTGCKQVVSNDQTQYDDDDGEKAVGDKKHNGHTDSEPEQDKSKKTFHTLTPFRWFGKTKFLISYFMHGAKKCYAEVYAGAGSLSDKNLCSKSLIFPKFWCKLVIMYFEF